jgi:hypothetical protein
MDEAELKLLLLGAGITIAFLGMRIYLDWNGRSINFDIGRKR